jgi:putative ABC transport system permease protein
VGHVGTFVLDGWLQDLRYAVRTLGRNPVFALTAAASLAVGIGANTTIFTIARAMLFKAPSGVTDSGRLVYIGRSRNGQGFDTNSYPNFLDIRSRSTVFTDVYADRIEPQAVSLGIEGGAERVFGEVVTTNYFSVLGARPVLGRLFAPSDGDEPGTTPFVVLSHRFWTRRFNADASVVGQTVRVNGEPFTVIGVAPEGFQGTTILGADLWVPTNMIATVNLARDAGILRRREGVWLHLGARLKPGFSLRQAEAELAAIARSLEQDFPDANRGWGLRVVPLSPVPGSPTVVVAFVEILMGTVALVLAIACANVAGVLLARAASRHREIAVRLAIGAGRARIIRQLLVETVVLFAVGAAAAFAIARGTLASLLPTLPLPVDVSLPIDGRVVAFTLALSLAAAILSGLAPALQASHADILSGLKVDGAAGRGKVRLRSAFVIAQVALSVVLVVGAGLFVRALGRAAAIDPGFDRRGVELAALDLSLRAYSESTGTAFGRDVMERVRSLPAVQAATLVRVVPLGGSRVNLGGLRVPGRMPPNGQPFFDADWNIVEPGYFPTMRNVLLAGRDFTASDRAGAPRVAIINETGAGRLFPGQDPVGRVVYQQTGSRGADAADQPLTIVGVARDAKSQSLAEPPRAFVFVPFQQQYAPRMTIAARSVNGQRLAAELRGVVASIDATLPIVASQTLEDYTSLGLVPQRVAASVSGSLGIVGLLLAALGVYGVTAYLVTTRTREIGIRVALGARPRDVIRMIVGQGLRLTLIGAAIGIVLAIGAGEAIASLLIGVGPRDVLTFSSVIVLFVLIGVAACYVPARRALRINANEALRYE